MERKILGLDLGVSSIGWALIGERENSKKILGIGTRIIPLSPDDMDEFKSGNAISKNQKRTIRRTQRKGYDRYQLRRKLLGEKLASMNMMPDRSLFHIDALGLYGLRERAVNEKIALEELGRIFFHLNQKRGYKSSKRDQSEDAKDTDYVKAVKDRHEHIREKNITIGQFFYAGLQQDRHYLIKKQIFPRAAYMEEFDRIWATQSKFYPEILTDNNWVEIRDQIIYYQRPLKSQKGLVSICEFEGQFRKSKEGKEIFTGPRVAPKSSPIAQVCRLWETINNITLKNRKGEEYSIAPEKKREMFDYLDNHKSLSLTELFKILGLGRNDGFYANKQLQKGIPGNVVKVSICDALKDSPLMEKLTQFNLNEEEYDLLDKDSGELLRRLRINCELEKQPLYQLWHVIYSIPDEEQLVRVLMTRFDLDNESATTLAALDFTKMGFGNKSALAMRNILPYLMQGKKYSEACEWAGYRHSDSLTTTENAARVLKDKLSILPKNSLRQPVVEKILNQMINVVNAIIEKHGRPDEIRVELARELKQSKEERNNTFNNQSKRERENKAIVLRLGEYGLRASRKNIEKWRLYEEMDGKEGRLNALCIYCGQVLGVAKAIAGDGVEVEHIIPRSRMFDDSFLNKTLAHTACNSAKGNLTAYDFMKTKSDVEFEQYTSRIEQLFKDQKISKAKRDKLLMSADKIPQDFILRQLRETQYISRKAREILTQICRQVYATSGSVTDYLRHQWGWTDALMNLQLPRYRAIEMTEIRTIDMNGVPRDKEFIREWTKRDDHRHHAVDALVVASTTPTFIKRLNDLNQVLLQGAESRADKLKSDESLKAYVQKLRPFTSAEVERAVSDLLISFKSAKRVAVKGSRSVKVKGKRQIVQRGIIVPRGPLSEESVYGKARKMVHVTIKLGPSFNELDSVVDRTMKKILKDRLSMFNNDPAKAFKALKNNPIWLDSEKTKALTEVVVRRWETDYVLKYPLQNITVKDADYIVDHRVRDLVKERLSKFDGNHKNAFKDLQNNPLWLNEQAGIQIKTVRLYTGLNAVSAIPVKGADGSILYEKYVKPGNNHHIAIYEDSSGKKHEHVVSFWHAVERVKRGLPAVIKNPVEVWDKFTQNADDESFLSGLPADGWKYKMSLQQNEMFVFNLNREEVESAIQNNSFEQVSINLFRLRKITAGNYWFNHQYETQPRESLPDKKAGRCVQASLSSLKAVKVRVSLLGQITEILELIS